MTKKRLLHKRGEGIRGMKPNSTHLEDSSHADKLIEGCGRIPSMVLSSLMTEAYPELERSCRMRNASGTEYKKRYK
jgi:hypothetical protein